MNATVRRQVATRIIVGAFPEPGETLADGTAYLFTDDRGYVIEIVPRSWLDGERDDPGMLESRGWYTGRPSTWAERGGK